MTETNMNTKTLVVEMQNDYCKIPNRWTECAPNISEAIERALLNLEPVGDDVKELYIKVVFTDINKD